MGAMKARPKRRNWYLRFALTGLSLLGMGFLAVSSPSGGSDGRVGPWFLVVGLALLVAPFLVWRSRRGGSRGTVGRWSRRSRRNDGVASPWAVLRTASPFALRRKGKILRPSFARLPFWKRWAVSSTEYGTPLAKVGRIKVWSSIEDVTLRVGGPRTGKSGELAGRILDAPGAVIATSTRTDLIDWTGTCRAQLGPVRVFNPSGVGNLPSSVTFDPLSGCESPSVATSRAADLLAGVSAPGSGGDREFWASQARRVLEALMHAAALGGGTMRDVLAWIADPDDAASEVQQYLRRSPEPAYVSDALQFLGTNERTRSSICATIMPALAWLTDSTAAAAATGGSLDVEELLTQRGTVYLLGAEDAQVTPLVTALTGHVAREARRIAGGMPGGRLDPPLTLCLDEAALICPIPLDQWTADMGGRNVTIHIGAQSRAQLRQRWGQDGAAAILNNTGTMLVFGGMKDDDDLQAYALLAGEREEEVLTHDREGNLTGVSTRRVPVLSPAQIAQLPPGHVLIVKRGMPPAVGRVEMAWKRPDVRKAKRAEARMRRAVRWVERGERFRDNARPVIEDVKARARPVWERIEARIDRIGEPKVRKGNTDA